MKIIKKVIRFGDSVGIIIDKVITKSLDINLGDEVEVIIRKVKE